MYPDSRHGVQSTGILWALRIAGFLCFIVCVVTKEASCCYAANASAHLADWAMVATLKKWLVHDLLQMGSCMDCSFSDVSLLYSDYLRQTRPHSWVHCAAAGFVFPSSAIEIVFMTFIVAESYSGPSSERTYKIGSSLDMRLHAVANISAMFFIWIRKLVMRVAHFLVVCNCNLSCIVRALDSESSVSSIFVVDIQLHW